MRLATTRRPAGEDEVLLVAQGTAILQTGDVAPGETIDPRLEFTAGDGSGVTYVDELEDYTLTRPTTEDCEAVRNPPPTPPSTPTATVEPTTPSASPSDGGSTGTSTRPTTPSSSSRPTTPGPPPNTPTSTSGSVGAPTAGRPTADDDRPTSGGTVIPGGTVTLRGAGFLPGERVDVLLRGTETVIGTATADPGGEIRVDVVIPEAAETGPATLDLVGADSATSTGVDLQVAALDDEVGGSGGALALASLVAAAVALVGTVGALVSALGRQHAERRGRHSPRSA
ncbi:hypothetical protein [Blastococcus atacamensis]|uniref:hypothetical protein n=1 Tax=Blastococcus atacamensis TaxID=2070508 RepID=UPI000CEBD359|nr:hypothetical protein [Blastococcus atacamensis]